MKPSVVVLVLGLTGVMPALAQTAPTTEPAPSPKSTLPRITLPPDKPANSKSAGTSANAANTAAKGNGATKTGAKKDEKPAKIEGIEIPRGPKGYMGIEIVNATFKLSFYDTNKKPVAPDVDRAALRWDPKYKVGEERVVLVPAGDAKALTSPKNIRPPYHFKLFITLLKDAAEGQPPVNETFTIDFRQ